MKDYVITGIRETYHELGEYEFKIILDPEKFKSSELGKVRFVDSDRRDMSYDLNKWGRKLNFKFKIDQSVSDGVAQIEVNVKNKDSKNNKFFITFWVIKPDPV